MEVEIKRKRKKKRNGTEIPSNQVISVSLSTFNVSLRELSLVPVLTLKSGSPHFGELGAGRRGGVRGGLGVVGGGDDEGKGRGGASCSPSVQVTQQARVGVGRRVKNRRGYRLVRVNACE